MAVIKSRMDNRIQLIVEYFQQNGDRFIIHPEMWWAEKNFATITNRRLQSAAEWENGEYRVFFICHDSSVALKYHNRQICFRTSLERSRKSTNEYVMPYIWDPITNNFNPLQPTEKPKVGYCGQRHRFRNELLSLIDKDGNIDSDFVLRNQFWGGKPHDPTIIKDFEENVSGSHFTVCNRGEGNFSMRFYQVLSSGRIPALVNTDMEFPFEDKINWNDYIVTGNSDQEVINNILETYKNRDIIQMQEDCYNLYQNFFTHEAFAKRLLTFLEEKYK